MVQSITSILSSSSLLPLLLLLSNLPSTAADFPISTRDEILASSRKLAKDVFTIYKGDEPGGIPGLLPGPPLGGGGGNDYYWINSASFFQTYITYQHLTGDDSFQPSIIRALTHQTGPNYDYMPPNQTASMGNDDQCFWGAAALQAAEYQLPNRADDPSVPPWIDMAKNVWNAMALPERTDDVCGGGLRWQFLRFNAGYDYKQTSSNACFFNLGARLARFTGNTTYAEHCEKTWEWMTQVGLIETTNSSSSSALAVYDGAHVEANCTDINKTQFSVNAALLTEGAAFMYNFTNGSDAWRDRTTTLADSVLRTFFPKGIAYEVACESKRGLCPVDALFMKGYLHRSLAVATQVAPAILVDNNDDNNKILPVFKTSADAAAKHCTENDTRTTTCGFYWSDQTFVDPQTADGTTGAGEGTSVLSAMASLLVHDAKAPATEKTTTGGGSGGGSGSGSGGNGSGSTGSATGTAGSGSSSTNSPSTAGHFGGDDVKMGLLVGLVVAFLWGL